MEAKKMATSLKLIASKLDNGAAEHLVAFAGAIEQEGTKSFGPLASKLEKAFSAHGLVATSSKQAEMVAFIAGVSEASGAGPLAKDFKAAARLVGLLSSVHPDQIDATVVKALTPEPKKSKAAAAPAVVVDVRGLADKLTSASHDNASFDALVAEVSKLPKDKLAEIAQRYLGYTRQFKSKPEIVKAIRARQLQDALDASRQRRISGIAV